MQKNLKIKQSSQQFRKNYFRQNSVFTTQRRPFLFNIMNRNNRFMTEKEIEKIRDTIKKLRDQLAGEKRRFGDYSDNGGRRYIIPELYIRIRDYRGGLNYYRWFTREFPDDTGFPSFNLFCTMILFQNEKIHEAKRAAYKTAFSNTYLIDVICNLPVVNIDKSEPEDSESLSYALEIAERYDQLLTKAFKTWLCSLNLSDEFVRNLKKYVSIQKLVKDEPAGPLRSHLISESAKLQHQLTEDEE